MTKILIGTSGWSYAGWKGNFYQDDMQSDEFLKAYARFFKTVEINNSFYNLPSEKNVKNWRELTSKSFVFSVKASRYITHNKKLKDPRDSTDKFFQAIKPLKEKVGPVLFQLPPNWKCNAERLEEFLKILPKKYCYTFEFRDRSWLNDEIYQILKKHKTALCLYDYKGYRSPEILTADFVYMRLHGPKKGYQGSYDGRRLNAYASKFKEWKKDGNDVFCYFDNDQKACAPNDAQRLIKFLEKR